MKVVASSVDHFRKDTLAGEEAKGWRSGIYGGRNESAGEGGWRADKRVFPDRPDGREGNGIEPDLTCEGAVVGSKDFIPTELLPIWDISVANLGNL